MTTITTHQTKPEPAGLAFSSANFPPYSFFSYVDAVYMVLSWDKKGNAKVFHYSDQDVLNFSEDDDCDYFPVKILDIKFTI